MLPTSLQVPLPHRRRRIVSSLPAYLATTKYGVLFDKVPEDAISVSVPLLGLVPTFSLKRSL